MNHLEFIKQQADKIEGSASVCCIVSEDWKLTSEAAYVLGFSLLMDKPIIFIEKSGVKINEKMRKVADDIIPSEPLDDLKARMEKAINRIEERKKNDTDQ